MDQIFWNRCLTWRVLIMCWDVAEMTIKRFFVSFSCTVSHKNETETKRRFQRSSLLVLPCYLWVCAELLIDLQYTKRKNILLSFLQCFNTFWARTMWGNGFQKFDPSYWVGGEGRWFCVRGSLIESFYCLGTRVKCRHAKIFSAEERETGTRSKSWNAGARER